jgi:hypothetical protein
MSVRSGRRKGLGEAGETLAELLVTISIISLAVVVLVGALGTAISASSSHRQHTSADTMARSIAEAFKNPDTSAASNPDIYVDCATSYPTTTVDTTGYTAVQKITYWKGTKAAREDTDFVSSCNTGDDNGLQLIKITVTSTGGKAESDTVSVLKRRISAP